MSKFKLTRHNIMKKAYNDCMTEMYKKAQPSANFNKLLKEFNEAVESGVNPEDAKFYDKYYLSPEEYSYIVDKYVKAYRFGEEWKDNIEVLEEYLTKGGHKSVYIEKNDGFPGYRGYEDVPPIKAQIANIINASNIGDEEKGKLIEELSKTVMDTIKECKNFYKFDKEEDQFRCNCALGASPTCNMQTVKDYWKQKTGKDIDIKERIPDLFWYYDEGYTDKDLAYEYEDLGPNWKQKLYEEWQEEKRQKSEKYNEMTKTLNE